MAKTKKKPVRVPVTFTPKFMDDVDGRLSLVKEMRRRYRRLKKHVGADSYQKQLLCKRAVFIAVRLETMEVDALSGKPYDEPVYTQMSNALAGLLNKLGLKKQAEDALQTLQEYMEEKQ